LMSAMVCQLALLASANHALRDPSAAGYLAQKARKVFLAITRIWLVRFNASMLPFWEQGEWSQDGT
jgi:hypothetical protein